MNPKDLEKANDVFAKYGLSQEEAFDLFIERTAELGEMPFPPQNEVIGSYRSLALALSGNYEELYYVDLNSDHFVKFYGKKGGQFLSETQRGDNFFDYFQDAASIEVHPLDYPYVSSVLNKESLLEELPHGGVVSAPYRSIAQGKPEYHRIRVVQIDEAKANHIVVGIINEDQQVRREKEWRSRLKNVKNMARIDQLTGLYNKNAFEQERRAVSRKIKAGKAQFAIVVCDLNNLKLVNDVSGHLMGDQFLKESAQRLARTFAPTKVFRIGGDEFAIVLQGAAYQNRMYLVSSLMNQSFQVNNKGRYFMAIGMAEFNAETDRYFSQVFVRADMAMYENKHKLKNG